MLKILHAIWVFGFCTTLSLLVCWGIIRVIKPKQRCFDITDIVQEYGAGKLAQELIRKESSIFGVVMVRGIVENMMTSEHPDNPWDNISLVKLQIEEGPSKVWVNLYEPDFIEVILDIRNLIKDGKPVELIVIGKLAESCTRSTLTINTKEIHISTSRKEESHDYCGCSGCFD